jgi:phosphatidylglycerophosphatase A
VDRELRLSLGLGYGDLLSLILQAYAQAPVPGAQNVEQVIRRVLNAVLRDPNVWAFIYADGELDAKAAAGAYRGLTPEEHAAGSKKIVADESLAVALAEYIGGFKAVLVLTG